MYQDRNIMPAFFDHFPLFCACHRPGYPDLAKVLKASDAHLLNAGQPLFLLGLAMNREDMGCYGHEAPEADSGMHVRMPCMCCWDPL